MSDRIIIGNDPAVLRDALERSDAIAKERLELITKLRGELLSLTVAFESARNQVRKNHQWHEEYGDKVGDYGDSELGEENLRITKLTTPIYAEVLEAALRPFVKNGLPDAPETAVARVSVTVADLENVYKLHQLLKKSIT